MIHPNVTLRLASDHVGYGVFASTRIPRGTITWTLDALDRVLSPDEVRAFGEAYADRIRRYTWLRASGDRILCWDFARFVNHSCDPNTASAGACDFDVALRDIEEGEEITTDYSILNLEEPFECACQTPVCRGVVRPEAFLEVADALDARVHAAFADVDSVPQLLAKWLRDPHVLRAAAEDPRVLGSIRAHAWPGDAANASRDAIAVASKGRSR